MALDKTARAPTSTYRLQLQASFDFAAATALVPYFRQLGISDLYLPPIFGAVPGSSHGYDVTDYTEVNPELGGLAGFRQLSTELRREGNGVILDFVPNHMGIAGMINQWWRDVLEFGEKSRFASFFDIQWNADFSRTHPQVLVPVLGDHYGRVLERGELKLVYDREFAVRYFDNTLPLRPDCYAAIWGPLDDFAGVHPEANALLDLLSRFEKSEQFTLSAATEGAPDPRRDYADLKGKLQALFLESAPLRTLLEQRLALLNGQTGNPASFDALNDLLNHQHYRLARWQAGAHEVNYRRFFAIDTLIGLHMENAEVFRACHSMVNRLLKTGEVSGLRIDHVDGLRQPEDYLRRVQLLDRPDNSQPLYVLVEKILEPGENLPATWPVHGTTGYEFIQQLAFLFVDPGAQSAFDDAYRRFTGESESYQVMVARAKRSIITEMFANAVSNLGVELVELLAEDRNWRDLTRHELTTAVSEMMISLPVYRTYRRRLEEVAEAERQVLEHACARALASNPRADPEPITFLTSLLIGKYPGPDAPESYRRRLLGWVLTFQQYTGAIMAKSVEDTSFYNFNRLIGLNEVGCDPGMFGGNSGQFHSANLERLARSPLSLLTTSTHDSKFSEDVRARLYAISELGAEWETWLADWKAHAARHVLTTDSGVAPDPVDQYRFFQVLLGVWPLRDSEVDETLRQRLKEHFRKAVEESKRHTSILNRNDAYLAACEHFVDAVFDTDGSGSFLSAFRPRVDRLARLGLVNSLAQVVLKCTSPGVPDFYQGNETWNFALVDPDNRRPVDYEMRQRLLEQSAQSSWAGLLENWRDGGIKLRVTSELLRFRRDHRALFLQGNYEPVSASGAFEPHVVAFRRQHDGESLLVIVPRLAARIGCPPVGPVWDDTALADAGGAEPWRDILTGRTHSPGKPLLLRHVCAELPFAVLHSSPKSNPHEN